MIVTTKYNEQQPKSISKHESYHLYQFTDGTHCAPVLIDEVEQMIQTDCNGDVWFVVPESVKLNKLSKEKTDKIKEKSIKPVEVDLNQNIGELHHHKRIKNGVMCFKSGLYTLDGGYSRTLPTRDEERQEYFDMFAAFDLSNVFLSNQITDEA